MIFYLDSKKGKFNMKVLFVVNWYTTKSKKKWEAGIFHREQAIALQEYCDICLYWPMDPEITNLQFDNENGLYTYRSEFKNTKNKIFWFINTLNCFDKIISEFKPDIIHANVAYPAGLVSFISAKKHHIPIVITEHAPVEKMHMNNLFFRFMRGYIYKNSDINTCVSSDLSNKLKIIFPKANFEVVYNAVINPNTMPKDYDIYRIEGFVNCAIVASFYDKEIKGYQYLIPAINELKRKGIKIVLHICGSGLFEDYYKQLVKKLNVEDRCIFYGQCNKEKLYSIISQMDFCVSSSIYESAGVAIEEAMLMGKPVLVTRSGGTDSLVTDYSAIVVNPGSVETLVDGLIKMKNEYADFDKNMIIEYAVNNFEISNVTKKIVTMYKKVLEKNNYGKK